MSQEKILDIYQKKLRLQSPKRISNSFQYKPNKCQEVQSTQTKIQNLAEKYQNTRLKKEQPVKGVQEQIKELQEELMILYEAINVQKDEKIDFDNQIQAISQKIDQTENHPNEETLSMLQIQQDVINQLIEKFQEYDAKLEFVQSKILYVDSFIEQTEKKKDSNFVESQPKDNNDLLGRIISFQQKNEQIIQQLANQIKALKQKNSDDFSQLQDQIYCIHKVLNNEESFSIKSQQSKESSFVQKENRKDVINAQANVKQQIEKENFLNNQK